MNRARLLDKLDRVTDRAATVAIARGFPIPITQKSTLVGNMFVEKSPTGFYNVLTLDRTKMYSDISVFDVAIIIAQRHSSGESAVVKKILQLEEKYSKYHTDMIHYLHCLRGAKKKHDLERMAILEDKFQVSETLAKNTRDRISHFKRVK